MKRITLIYIFFFLFSIPALSLNPFNFSWNALDNTGQILPNEVATLTVKIQIIQGTTVLYEETHSGISTDQFAIFTVRVGTGTTTGDLLTIGSTTDLRISAEVKKGTGSFVLCSVMGISSWLTNGSNNLWTDMGSDDIARITGASNYLMTIKSSGDVGIGTNAPSAMLDIQLPATKSTAINIGKLDANGQKGINLDIAADNDGDFVSGMICKMTTGTGHIAGTRFATVIKTEIESDATFTFPTSNFPIDYVIYNTFKTNADVAGEYHSIMNAMRNHTILNGDHSSFTGISNWLQGDGNYSSLAGMYNYIELSGNNISIAGVSNVFRNGSTLSNDNYTGLKNTVSLEGDNSVFFGHKDDIQSNDVTNTAYSLVSTDNNTSTAGTIYGVYLNFNDTDLTRWGIYQAGGSTNFFNGNVGIGTNAPARKLHVSDAMRLEPLSAAPSSPATGDMYMDDGTNTSNGNPKLMVYDGTTWQECW